MCRKLCHREPVRRLVWRSVPLIRHSGSDPTAAGGGSREGSEWQRSVGDEGRKTEDIHRVPQTEISFLRLPRPFGARNDRGSMLGLAPTAFFLRTRRVGACPHRPMPNSEFRMPELGKTFRFLCHCEAGSACRGNPFPLPPKGRRKATLCKNCGLPRRPSVSSQ